MNETAERTIQAHRVPENERPDFLPRHFPHFYAAWETLVYDTLNRICPEYFGGYWQFYTTDNGAAFMVPEVGLETLLIEVPDNFCSVRVSPEAAGLIACLYATNYIANSSRRDYYIEAYHSLRDFALEHPEAPHILAAID